jgi:DegV family protein with EDD domain
MQQPTARRSATAVVTDSTAHLSQQEVADLGISVVPLEVVISGQTGLDGIDVDADQVAAALSAWEPVTTSRPAPARFLAAYEKAKESGASEVVSVHLSGELSGTVDAARIAAREASIPVTVVDSRQIALGLGFAVLDAARSAQDGEAADAVAAVAQRASESASTLFYVDTLEYLRRGGRIGAASAFLGGVLAVKPLLEVSAGRIEPLEKVRTAARALGRLQDLAVGRAGSGPVRLGIHHLAAPERAQQVHDALQARLPEASPTLVRELGAVIGAHVGPGVVAVVVSPA